MKLVALLALLFCACGPEPVYDDDLGVTPVATAPGALAGFWAQKSRVVNLGDFPLVGEQRTGSEIYHLVERTFDEATQQYALAQSACGGRLFETVGGSSFIETETWQVIRPVGSPVVEVDHGQGTFAVTNYVDLWSIDLDDPYEDDFPIDAEEAGLAPHRDRIRDGDSDGNPGVTMRVDGLATGEVFFAQRRTGDYRGAVLSEDEIVGVNHFERDQVTLGATSDLLNNSLPQRAHPDPLESYFHEVRLGEGATCDDVLAAIDDELIPRVRNFGPER